MDFDFIIINGCESEPDVLEGMASAFNKRGYKTGLISSSHIDEKILSKKGFAFFNIDKAIEQINTVNKGNYREIGEEYCKKYDIDSMMQFVLTDEVFYAHESEPLIIRTLKYFIAIEEYFKENTARCFVQFLGSEVLRKACRYYAKKHNIPTLTIGQPFFDNKLLIYEDELGLQYDYTPIPYENITEEDRVQVRKYIEAFLERKKVWSYAVNENDSLWDDFKKVLLYLKKRQYYVLRGAINSRIAGIYDKFCALLSKKYYSAFDAGIKYIYYPLNCPTDTEIILKNPLFLYQDMIAEYISRCMPEGYCLYVKEHPTVDISGALSMEQRKNVIRRSNVRFLPPNLNSHDIIKNAAAVIIVSSTVGFEAIHYFKPVIVLGKWTLENKCPAILVNDIRMLPEAIKKALVTKIKEEDVISFLYSLKKSSSDGNVCLKDKDIDYKTIVDSLLKKALRLGAVAER